MSNEIGIILACVISALSILISIIAVSISR